MARQTNLKKTECKCSDDRLCKTCRTERDRIAKLYHHDVKPVAVEDVIGEAA